MEEERILHFENLECFSFSNREVSAKESEDLQHKNLFSLTLKNSKKTVGAFFLGQVGLLAAHCKVEATTYQLLRRAPTAESFTRFSF